MGYWDAAKLHRMLFRTRRKTSLFSPATQNGFFRCHAPIVVQYSLVWNKRPGRLLIFWQFGHRVGLIPSGRLLIFGDDSDFIEVTVTSLLSKGSFISYSRLFIFGELSHGVFYFIGSCIPYQRVPWGQVHSILFIRTFQNFQPRCS